MVPTAFERPRVPSRWLIAAGLAIVLLVGVLPPFAAPVGARLASASGTTMSRLTRFATPGALQPAPATPPNFPPPNWRLLNTTAPTPPTGTGGSVAYLAGAVAVVWVGGSSAGTVQTWEFASGNWTNLTSTVTGAPPPNPGGALAAAPFADEVLWTSPYAGASTMGLWSLANHTWTNDSSFVPSPPARVGASWASDPANNTAVLFGGTTNGIFRNDTWKLGASGWTSVAAPVSPSPRADAGMAAPGSGSALVLTGGQSYAGPLNDTWTFNGATWNMLVRADAPRGITFGPSALAPTPGGALLAFGGAGCATLEGLCNRTYEYSPTSSAWENVTSQGPPSPRAGMELAYDAAAGYDLAIGGEYGPGAPASESWAVGGPLTNALVVIPLIAQPPTTAYYISHAAGGYGTYTYVFSGQNVDCISRNVSNFRCPQDNDDNGSYTITGQVTDQMGNVTRASAAFQVLRSLDVLENLSAHVVDAGQPVNYSMNLSAPSAPVRITWVNLPPDCPMTNATAFTCASTVPGFYGVSCNVTDQYGTTAVSTTLQLQINPDPSVIAWPSVLTGLAPLSETFASSVSGGTGPFSYNWSFGDGTFGVGASVTHTFPTDGSYGVSVVVTDAVGVTATLAAPISVDAASALSAVISTTAGDWGAPARVTFNATVAGGTAPYSYRWTLGNDATSTQSNVTTTYGEPGTYSVTVTVLDAHGLVATASTSITVTSGGANGTTSGSGGASPPIWELAGGTFVGVLAGAAIGIWIGRRRPRPESGER